MMDPASQDHTSDVIETESAPHAEGNAGMPRRIRLILMAALVLLLIAIGIAGYMVVREVRRGEAPTTMAAAEIAQLNAQIEQTPDDLVLYLRLADVYYSAGDYDSAEEEIQKVTSRETTGTLAAQAVYGLARVSEAKGEVETAIERYQESLELEELPDTVYNLGRLYLSEEMVDEGIQQWERYIVLVPTEAGVIRDLAKVHEADGNKARALELFQEAAVYIPDDEEVQEALARLGSGTEQ